MGKYIDKRHLPDMIQVLEEDILYAEKQVEGEFGEFEEPYPPQLLELVKLLTLQRACIRLAQTEDTIYMEKAKGYKSLAEDMKKSLVNAISRRNTALGTVRFQRG